MGGLCVLCGRSFVRVRAYVDGFNLYYGIRKHPSCKWLDVNALITAYLEPGDSLEGVDYFTARVRGTPLDPGAPTRQQMYLRALQTLPNFNVHFGRFAKWERWMPLASPIGQLTPAATSALVIKVEEKGSDVALGARLIADCYEGRFDVALVVSNDTDLCPPIEIVRSKGLAVGILNPQDGFGAKSLRSLASFYKEVRHSVLLTCQLPNPVIDARGRVIPKPVGPGW